MSHSIHQPNSVPHLVQTGSIHLVGAGIDEALRLVLGTVGGPQ